MGSTKGSYENVLFATLATTVLGLAGCSSGQGPVAPNTDSGVSDSGTGTSDSGTAPSNHDSGTPSPGSDSGTAPPSSDSGTARPGNDSGPSGAQSGGCAPAPQIYGNVRAVWSLALGGGTLAGAAVDPANNVVVAGSTSDVLTIGAASVAAPAARNPFVLHLDPNGKLVSSWTLPGPAEAQAMGVDAQGNVYLAGFFNSALDFGNGPLSGSLFLVKLDPSGKALWSHGYPVYMDSTESLGANLSMAVDAAGDVALSSLWVAPVDFGGGVPDGGESLGGFVVEFDSAGNYRFTHVLNNYYNTGANLQFDPSGNLAIAVSTLGDLGLGAAVSTSSYTASAAKLDPMGNVLWLDQDGAFDNATAVAASASTTYFTGNFAGQFGIASSVMAHGSDDTFVGGFDGTGRPTFETGLSSLATFSAMAVDPSGGVVAIGTMPGVSDLGEGPLSSLGIALAKYDDAGHAVFSARFGVATDPPPSMLSGQSVAFDGTGAIVTSGQFMQSIDLGSGVLAASPNAQSYEGTIFVAKYVEEPSTPSPNQVTTCPPDLDAGSFPDTGTFVTTTGIQPPLALSADSLYWSTGTEVMGQTFDGGPPVVIAFDQKNTVALATDPSALYWANAGTTNEQEPSSGPGDDGQIWVAPFDGGPAATLASALVQPYALAVDETGVYWTGGGNGSIVSDGGIAPGVLMGTAFDGGVPSVLLSGLANPYALAARSGVIVFSTYTPGTGTSAIEVTTSAGAPPVMLATSTQQISSVALDGNNAYWWESSTVNVDVSLPNARLRSAPLAGGPVTTILDQQPGGGSLVIVGSQLFFATTGTFADVAAEDNGGIYSLTLGADASSLVTVLGGSPGVSSLAVDANHLAWAGTIDAYNGVVGVFVQAR